MVKRLKDLRELLELPEEEIEETISEFNSHIKSYKYSKNPKESLNVLKNPKAIAESINTSKHNNLLKLLSYISTHKIAIRFTLLYFLIYLIISGGYYIVFLPGISIFFILESGVNSFLFVILYPFFVLLISFTIFHYLLKANYRSNVQNRLASILSVLPFIIAILIYGFYNSFMYGFSIYYIWLLPIIISIILINVLIEEILKIIR